MDLLVKTEKLI